MYLCFLLLGTDIDTVKPKPEIKSSLLLKVNWQVLREKNSLLLLKKIKRGTYNLEIAATHKTVHILCRG